LNVQGFWKRCWEVWLKINIAGICGDISWHLR
jgi:hypothetical protein